MRRYNIDTLSSTKYDLSCIDIDALELNEQEESWNHKIIMVLQKSCVKNLYMNVNVYT